MNTRVPGLGLSFTALLLLASACDSTPPSRQGSEPANESSGVAIKPVDPPREPYSDTMAIVQRVDSINTLREKKRGRFEMYARVYGGGKILVPVSDPEAWPEDTEISINVFRDKDGTVLYHWESPTSESGDWTKSVTHYFDPKGRTIFREYYTGSFGLCEHSDIIRSTIRTFVDPATGNTMAETRAVTDADEKAFKNPDECVGSGPVEAPKRSVRELLMPSRSRKR